MQSYKNISGQSGVVAYQPGLDHIIVQFRLGREKFYKYTYSSAGSVAVEHMKQLANAGIGLNSYISSKATEPNYAVKSAFLAEVL